ncbi:MAG: methyltransferase domain-containing protein [Nitrospiria bacterium]
MNTGTFENRHFFTPVYRELSRNDLSLLIDSEAPNWIATDTRGAKLIRSLNQAPGGTQDFTEIVANYCKENHLDWTRGWLHCQTFIQDALRAGFISTSPFLRAPYPGRAEVLKLNKLSELWLHVTNACNISCEHCLVDSSPSGIPGEGLAFWKETIEQAKKLGVRQFYITGGEPFLRSDIFDLIDTILSEDTPHTELIILSNGMLFRGKKLKQLSRCDPSRLHLQISLDGPTAEINDAIRGRGTFDAAVRGIKEAVNLGFSPTLTSVVNRSNIDSMKEMVHLASSLDIKNIHLLLSHHRGRALSTDDLKSPSNPALLKAFLEMKNQCDRAEITFDNYETLLGKLMGQSGVKVDLSNAAYETLCVYADGNVYPTAALSGIPSLQMGTLRKQSLEEIWRNAPMAKQIRSATVQNKKKCKDCYLKFLCGGGDLEHTFLYSSQFLGEDPFSEFYEEWILDTLFSIAEKKEKQKTRSGYDRPIIYAAMGEDAILEDNPEGTDTVGGFEVALSRSACVLSVDLDHSRRVVSNFYGDAADSPQPQLCCPEGYSMQDSDHIPKEVLEISYGCGSPVGLADIIKGETMVDLGSGGGIDCFIASKKVGPSGKVVGVDMTDQMLKKAMHSKKEVIKNLGYNNLEFKKGYLEEIPLPDRFANLVTSNCVINLSPDKKQVFVEIWRVLKDFGRIVISDTITEKPLPEGMRANPRLWGECVSGALTEEEYLSNLERAGFYGLSILKRTLWKEVDGFRFYSAVIQGYKFEKKAGCKHIGQQATYLGPMQAVIDEEGHLFPRDQVVPVCTDTAEKLQKPPYQSSFTVTQGDVTVREKIPEGIDCCPPENEGCC